MKRPRGLVQQFALTAFGAIAIWACRSSAWQPQAYTGRSMGCLSLCMRHEQQDASSRIDQSRRKAILSSLALAFYPIASPAVADVELDEIPPPITFTRQSEKYGYTFQPPPPLSEGKKPLKTHLDEVNFFGPSGYQIGITVDPVRIDSLAEFGTPAEVAAKVVLAEVNRDGVFNVKLMQDPVAGKQGNIDFIQLDYLSEGKRGLKRFVCKFMIHRNMLYALTAQCKQDEFGDRSQELLQAVESFQII